MNRKKITSLLLITVFILTTLAIATPIMATVPEEVILATKGDATAAWSNTEQYTGKYSAHLKTTGIVETGDEARIVIQMPDGFTLGDLETISWWEYLIAGYPPHVDVYLDAGDELVFEYACNNDMTGSGKGHYGAETGAWFPTFNDNPSGLSQIADTAKAWANSGPPGGPDPVLFTLAEWKLGETYTTDATYTIDSESIVTKLEIEVDNWIVQTEAYIDDIKINDDFYQGMTLDAEIYGTGADVEVSVVYAYANSDPMRIDAIKVKATSNTDVIGIDVHLTETGADTGVFTGSFPTTGEIPPPADHLVVDDGDKITVIYIEEEFYATADIDDIAPEIIITPLETVKVDKLTNVFGTYVEPHLETIIVEGIDAEIDWDGLGTFRALEVPLLYGNNTITAVATDLSGFTSSSSTWIVSDTLGPVVTDAMAKPPKAIATGTTDLSVKVTDEWSVVTSVIVDLTEIGGSKTQAMEEDEGLWEYTATVEADIEDEVYYLNITAEDDLGNKNAEDFFVFEVVTDTVPPVMGAWAVDYPIGKNSARDGDDVKVGVIATDLPAGVSYVEINGTEITGVPELVEMDQIGSPNYYYTYLTVTSDVPDETYYLNITATDYAGNKASTLAEVLIQELATMDMYTLSADYDPGDTVDFYVKASFAFNLTIEITDPTSFPYKTIKCIEDEHWIRVEDYSTVPYKASFELPGTAVSGTWNWTALEGDKEVSDGTFAVGVTYTGTLSINTTPFGGEVFVDDEFWGMAPVEQEVEVGSYTVSFGAVEGYITPSAEEAEVTADTTTEIEGTYVEIPELPAETTDEETLDSNGNPKTSFVSGETVLVSADICNVGQESQTMLIVIQLTDPDLRVLPPLYIQITLLPGQSIIPAIGFALPTTGYATGTWTAKIMVLDKWPAQGGVPIGPPVIITFTVS